MGIERLTALRRIDLSSNKIKDVSPLGKLPTDRVERIDLRWNSQISCNSLNALNVKFPGKLLRPTACLSDEVKLDP